MPKRPVSVTLDQDNLLWLRARVIGERRRSLSDVLDEVVTAARLREPAGEIRSVAGTIDISADDPELRQADAAVRREFEASLSRPAVERAAPGRGTAGRAGRRRG